MSMPRPQVFKFGGTSVGSAEALRLALARVRETRTPLVVVVSAMAGVTDLLLGAARAAQRGADDEVERAVAEFQRRHQGLVAQLIGRRQARLALEEMLGSLTAELRAICQSVRVLRELTDRTLDAAAARGERMMARTFSTYLAESGVRSAQVDATEVLFAQRTAEGLWPELERSERAARKTLRPLLARGSVVVVPGFIAAGPDGEVVTLGRGGSDVSATLLGRFLGARAVTLFKDVDGLMTADPKAVPDARVLPEMHYREAAELAYYGAKVLHPRTLIPLVDRDIPLFLRNSFNPGFPGTRIAGDVPAGEYPVKALSAVRGQALISIEGKGMIGVPGIAARTFGALAQAGLSVSMISQASSEASICFVVPQGESDAARRALERAFAQELESRVIEGVRIERAVSLVAVVGLGMVGRPGIAARTTAPLAHHRINIRAIAQGSSELNITVAIRDQDVPAALRALHEEFQLHKLRPLPDTQGRGASVVLFGLGQIGRTLARQILRQQTYFRHGLGLEIRVAGVCDRSGYQIDPGGFDRQALETILARKESGRPLKARRRAGKKDEVLRALQAAPLSRPILVDVTAQDDATLIQEALTLGFHVVLANKKPLAAPQAVFDALFATARERGLELRYEATVGAGLPILDTLRKLHEAGDKVHTVVGALSGTLGFVMTELEQGIPFSEAVRTARELGYTEPDPSEDLSGADVARKALILARTIGRKVELGDVAVERLFPAFLSGLAPEAFMARLPQLDKQMADRVTAARKSGAVLRYLARIDRRVLRVGLEAVPQGSPPARLQGLDNQVALYTDRYKTNPLVVTGPGAGAEVTASGVLNDILAIASAERRRPAP
jgi:aspartokinase/homoserine dehydrogenase 1